MKIIKDLYLEDMKNSYNSVRIGLDVFPKEDIQMSNIMEMELYHQSLKDQNYMKYLISTRMARITMLYNESL